MVRDSTVLSAAPGRFLNIMVEAPISQLLSRNSKIVSVRPFLPSSRPIEYRRRNTSISLFSSGTSMGSASIGPSSSAQGIATDNALASSTPRSAAVAPAAAAPPGGNATFSNAFNTPSIHNNNNRPSDDENSSLASGAESLGAGGSLGGNGHHIPAYHRTAHSASPTHKPVQPFQLAGPPFPTGDYHGDYQLMILQC